jgi:thymidylate synthase ThyX
MKITEPKVELLSELDITPESHIARCARVCYGREYKEPNQEADEKMVDGLIKRGHLSMLRHSSVYYEFLPYERIPTVFMSEYVNSIADSKGYVWASTNRQFAEEKNILNVVGNCSPAEFLENYCVDEPLLFKLYRLTFCITTQISTSRELNRVSPNNIAERSTRYYSSKDGLLICRPWWYDETTLAHDMYKANMEYLETAYKYLLGAGMKPEDARGILPLDTATKVIYTYSVKEWQHILDLRYYGTTGRPHPNAKLVIGMVREQINQFAKENNIDFQV